MMKVYEGLSFPLSLC